MYTCIYIYICIYMYMYMYLQFLLMIPARSDIRILTLMLGGRYQNPLLQFWRFRNTCFRNLPYLVMLFSVSLRNLPYLLTSFGVSLRNLPYLLSASAYVIYHTCLRHLASAYVVYSTCLRHLASAYVSESTGSLGYMDPVYRIFTENTSLVKWINYIEKTQRRG